MANEFILTLLDTMQIQKYIFGSNRLQEMIGASEIVRWCSDTAITDILGSSESKIEDGAQSEIVYAGGGNAKILFDSIDRAREFTRLWSRKVLQEAPGLRIAVHHEKFNMDEDFRQVVNRAERSLARKKRNYPADADSLAVPFVARCLSTGKPATGHYSFAKQNIRISDEARSKRVKVANLKNDLMPEELKETYGFPSNLEELGQVEGRDYIGIIHADGNRLGQKIMNLVATASSMREYIDRIRLFSDTLDKVNEQAFHNSLLWLEKQQTLLENEKLLKPPKIKDGKDAGKKALVARPIIVAGDDLTVITAGVVALQFCTRYQNEFQKLAANKKEAFGGNPLTASAGVAIVHSSMPFDSAYEVAESLAASAKQGHGPSSNPEDSRIDWHIATDSNLGEIGDLRNQGYQYQMETGHIVLSAKPYALEHTSASFSQVVQAMKVLKGSGNDDGVPRTRLKRLLNLASEDPQAAEQEYNSLVGDLPESLRIKFKKIFTDLQASEKLFKRTDQTCSTVIFDLVESMEFIHLETKGGEA